ncbi:hypothetical protein [Sphingomicrobium lutaoense]|uniref:Uncharacterized protein n=1 Tax=Sphingomicrobium lutaoense TaxID=515949 RepID=A0A839Z1S0_9SPHN|nr:hypothetical protein [Sphingomicrobium lutaoense]MBB3763535.1 hypothetical protein [Sphingomicrobium lutaoense]
MDEKRRKALEERRAKMQADLARSPGDDEMQKALDQRGVPFEPSQVGLWTPQYLAISSSRIDWSRSPLAAECWKSEGLAARVEAVGKLLQRVAAPSDWLHFFFDDSSSGIDLQQTHALRALDILLDTRREVWITARPANWLIEVDRCGTTRLALPPILGPTAAAAAVERQMAYVGALVRPLREDGVPVSVYARDDPAGPDLPRGAVVYNWRQNKRTEGLPLDRGDYQGLAARLREFLEQTAPGITLLAYDLGYDDSPIVLTEAEKLLERPQLLMAPIECGAYEKHVNGLLLSAFSLFPPDGSWVVSVHADGPRWKVESTAWK